MASSVRSPNSGERRLTDRPPPSLARGRVSVLQVQIDRLDAQAVLSRVEEWVTSPRSRQIVTANALMILASEKKPDLLKTFREADLVIPDSAGILLAARWQDLPFPQKTSGVDLVELLCRRAEEKGWTIFFLGAAPGVAADAAENLRKQRPRLKIAGVQHGYFSFQEEGEVLQKVADAAPDILFVALDVPRQDVWIHNNLRKLNARVAMGVGGSFDVLSGRLRRAPRWMRSSGSEWLFRLIQQPWRAWRMVKLPVFFWKVFWKHGVVRFISRRAS